MTAVLPSLTFHGRLPGVDCSPALPVGEAPVRLDVAGFVGFAEKGPLDTPIAVEDVLEYAAVFGGDLALAQEGGRAVFAQLPQAVRSFFDNGGRRCYVVRVAGPDAVPGRWEIPGLQVWQPDGSIRQAAVESAWPGAWSAGTSVRTALLTQQLTVGGPYLRLTSTAAGRLPLTRGAIVGLQPGDLLRLDLGLGEPGLFVRIGEVDAALATVSTDLEVAYAPGDPDVPAPLELAGLPATIAVVAAQLHRFDLVVRQHTRSGSRLVERHHELAFGPGAGPRPHWSVVLQEVPTGGPDRTRSLTLRQDQDTLDAAVTGLVVPVGMSEPGTALDLDENPADTSPLQEGDDDLDNFDPAWFIDDNLATDTVFSLGNHADQLTVLSRTPLQLKGIHAFIDVDEVALIAVPDATNRGWSEVVPADVDDPPEPEEPEPLDWSDFRCCSDEVPAPPPPEEPVLPTQIDLLPELDRTADYDEGPLLAVQVALVTMCAAEADRVAMLSVPAHYDVSSTLAWRAGLCADGRISDTSGVGISPLSFAALWHPWVSITTGQHGTRSILRDVPPDGTVAGMIAARELDRGAWIAPAGVPLRGVVRLARELSEGDEIQLFNAHANLLDQLPGTFSTLSAHTLSGDRHLLQLNVRRLLILLRKICLRLGARYTFEVNNDRFRQLVRMRFDRILTALVDRGALHAFQVLTDASVNTPAEQDAGRLLVVLKVAPTSPVEFITVTLLRSGEGLLDVLEG